MPLICDQGHSGCWANPSSHWERNTPWTGVSWSFWRGHKALSEFQRTENTQTHEMWACRSKKERKIWWFDVFLCFLDYFIYSGSTSFSLPEVLAFCLCYYFLFCLETVKSVCGLRSGERLTFGIVQTYVFVHKCGGTNVHKVCHLVRMLSCRETLWNEISK